MRSNTVGRLVLVGAILAMLVPVSGYAQEATLIGTVTDSTGGVLPGVTVRAVNEASGNSFEAVTGARGEFRIPVRIGSYKVTAELSSFTTATRSVTLLVGQEAVLNLQMSPSGVQETVTVTGEAPLVEVTQSKMGGNIDPRQMQELPVNGRDMMNLALLAPGNRMNQMDDEISRGTGTPADLQLNVDGQQVTNNVVQGGGFGQPRYSRDAIAEFEFVANRFDATQGRSSGAQINVVSKSGTNTPSGSLSGYFRDSSMNAADFVAHRVLPYSDQQVSTTFGGPIVKDKAHFFANYEFERNPETLAFTTPYPSFNLDQSGARRENKAGGRVDFEFSPKLRLSARGNYWNNHLPIPPTVAGTATPATLSATNRDMDQFYAVLTHVISNRAMNEIKGGYAKFHWNYNPLAQEPNSPITSTGFGGAPTIRLRGLTIGPGTMRPQDFSQNDTSLRDDFTYSFAKGGRHAFKAGGEYIHNNVGAFLCNTCIGELQANGGPRPANLAALFPNILDPSTWNLAPLSTISVRWRQAVGDFNVQIPHNNYAAWLQDDWTITPRLTLNLGVRYDLMLNAFVNDVGIPPFIAPNRPNEKKDVAPRLGFAYSMTDRTVFRGGYGKYYTELQNPHQMKFWSQVIIPATSNDGRPDFASNPFNGHLPTFQQLVQAGTVREISAGELLSPNMHTPYSHQGSIGLQHQLGSTTAIQADYVYTGGRQQESIYNANLNYNAVTGSNLAFSVPSNRPLPNWGDVEMNYQGGWSNSHALETAFTKRMSQRWQASVTYTLSAIRDATSAPMHFLQDGTLVPVPFPGAPDLGGQYTLAAGDQRHRAVFNGIWQIGYGFQLSGLYFYGSGQRFVTVSGCGDCRDSGGNGEDRLRADGTITPRNNLVGSPIHRVDLRLLKQFQLGRARVEGIAELFNVFNHANYGSYTTDESNPSYGLPASNNSIAYLPRIAQLGFRFMF